MKPMPDSRRSRVAQCGDVLVGQPDRPGGERDHADDRLDQLGLAVALDAGDAEHLTGVDREVDVAEHRAADRVDDLDAREHEPRLRR